MHLRRPSFDTKTLASGGVIRAGLLDVDADQEDAYGYRATLRDARVQDKSRLMRTGQRKGYRAAERHSHH